MPPCQAYLRWATRPWWEISNSWAHPLPQLYEENHHIRSIGFLSWLLAATSVFEYGVRPTVEVWTIKKLMPNLYPFLAKDKDLGQGFISVGSFRFCELPFCWRRLEVGHGQLTQLYLDHGAVSFPNDRGDLPEDLARNNHHYHLIPLLATFAT